MKETLIILTLLIICSCKKNKNEAIYGNWYFEKVVDYDSTKSRFPKIILEIDFGNYYNFEILNDSVLDFKSGFVHHIRNQIKINDNNSINKGSQYYLGTKTNYIFNKNNIIFFNKSLNNWDTLKIKHKSKDTLILKGFENANYLLIKKNRIKNKIDFDAIVVERSPCFGSCPFNSTYIDRKGNYFFKGYDSNTQDRNFRTKLNSDKIKYYFQLFETLNLREYKGIKSIQVSDTQKNLISFFKNGKRILSLNYNLNTPIDLIKAYQELSFAYQTLPIIEENDFIFSNKVNYFKFTNNINILLLNESEGYFLETALRMGNKVSKKSKLEYEIEFNNWEENTNVNSILSDGRYYQINYKDNTSVTIDIGFNFIDKNPDLKTKKKE